MGNPGPWELVVSTPIMRERPVLGFFLSQKLQQHLPLLRVSGASEKLAITPDIFLMDKSQHIRLLERGD